MENAGKISSGIFSCRFLIGKARFENGIVPSAIFSSRQGKRLFETNHNKPLLSIVSPIRRNDGSNELAVHFDIGVWMGIANSSEAGCFGLAFESDFHWRSISELEFLSIKKWMVAITNCFFFDGRVCGKKEVALAMVEPRGAVVGNEIGCAPHMVMNHFSYGFFSPIHAIVIDENDLVSDFELGVEGGDGVRHWWVRFSEWECGKRRIRGGYSCK